MEVYLDNHTVTRPYPEALDQLLNMSRSIWRPLEGAPCMGQDPRVIALECIKNIFNSLGADVEDQFFFCNNGSEAIKALFEAHFFENIERSHVLLPSIANASTMRALKKWGGNSITHALLPLNIHGQITLESVQEAITPNTSLISLSGAHLLTGVIQPIEEISALCHSKGIRLHVDISSIIGKVFFCFSDLLVDYVTFDGSLFHAPQQTGGVIVKKGVAFDPFNRGGAPVGALSGLSKALMMASSHFEYLNLEIARLREVLELGIKKEIENAWVVFEGAQRLPNCSVIIFPGVESDALLYLLNCKQVYASIGGGHTPSLFHHLRACGISASLAHCALSLSLSYETTEEQIMYTVNTIIQCVKQLSLCSMGLMEDL